MSKTGIVKKVVHGAARVDRNAFAFIQPDDGSPDVFAPARTHAGGTDRNIKASEGQKVEFDVKEDDRTGKVMASYWKILDDRSSRSRSKSSRSRSSPSRGSRPRSKASRSRARSQRSRSKRSRSRSRRSDSPRHPSGHKVTICDIPPDMTDRELRDLAKDQGRSLVWACTYKHENRYCGLVEYADKADADHCIAELDSRKVDGSQLRLRVVHGTLHTEQNGVGQQSRGSDSRGNHSRSQAHGGPATGVSSYVRPGDWECSKCGMNVFASKTECFKCHTPKQQEGARGHASDEGGPLMTVYVPDMPEDIREDDVRHDFEKSCARLSIIRIVLVKRKGLTGCFIRFSAVKYAKRAIEDIEDQDIRVRGRVLRAEMARTNTSVHDR